MIEIDWSKAPEGATHYCPGNRLFYKFDGAGRGQCTSRGARWTSCGDRDDYESGELTPRPSSPAWNGEGLPPVNTRCEYIDSDGQWIKCEVVAHRNNAAVILDDHYECALVVSRELRPIRTPEQIAAEEREKAVQEMLSRFAIYDIPRVPWENLFNQIYDAGYRKVEP